MNLGKVSIKRKLISLITVILLFLPSCFIIFADSKNVTESLVHSKNKVLHTHTNNFQDEDTQNIINKNLTINKAQENITSINNPTDLTLTNESWICDDSSSSYTLNKLSNDSTEVLLNNPIEYSYISKYIPISYSNGKLPNTLAIDFFNIEGSITHISFYLQGDPKILLDNGYETYYEYYRSKLGEYSPNSKNTSENVNLTFDISTALKELEGHLNSGLKLILLIESDPQYSDNYDKEGKLLIKNCMTTYINYPHNTFSNWIASDSYNISNNVNNTRVEYSDVNDFDYLYCYVYNHSPLSSILNLELNNLDKSVENITINVYDTTGKTVNIPINLTKYSKEFIHLKYDLHDYNNQINIVNKIELLIDSNPYKATNNNKGNLEIISAYFSSDKK